MSITAFFIVVAGLVFLVWLSLTELSYLSAGAVRWIYERVSNRYERKWNTDPYRSGEIEARLFLAPLKQALEERDDARLLDLACGTGRISMLVLAQPWFRGRVEALDFSPGMLRVFHRKLDCHPPARQCRVTATQQDVKTWMESPRDNFDAIAYTEASEILPNFAGVVRSVSNCLKPRGLFLLTIPPDSIAWLFFGRQQTTRQIRAILAQHGFTTVEILPWRWRYSVVHAWKDASNST